MTANFFSTLERDAAFTRVSAFIILKGGEHVGTVKISFPRDGAGTLKAYCEDFSGETPVRSIGKASGYGYDKRTAAMSGQTFCGVELRDNGYDWTRQLRDAGLTVVQAV